MTEPTDATLQQRCAEILEWQRTGVLTGNALRDYAAQHWPEHHDALQMSERDTSARAIELIAKWGAPPAVAGEPVAWRYVPSKVWGEFAYTEDPKRAQHARDNGIDVQPVFTTPQPTQAGAVESAEFDQFLSDVLTAAGLVTHGKQCKALGERLADMCVKLRLHGIKGGQHGAE